MPTGSVRILTTAQRSQHDCTPLNVTGDSSDAGPDICHDGVMTFPEEDSHARGKPRQKVSLNNWTYVVDNGSACVTSHDDGVKLAISTN